MPAVTSSTSQHKPWFAVHRKGLRQLLADQPKSRFVNELIQNAWDQDITTVEVSLTKLPGSRYAEVIVVDDDPNGFADLSHAYTLFAESTKKADPTRRGRFDIGEKLMIALCESATITTTTGSVIFDEKGRRKSRKRREVGSEFFGRFLCSNDELAEVAESVLRLISPEGITTKFNGTCLVPREAIAEVEVSLPTVISGDDGVLRRTTRKTVVRLYEPTPGARGTIYEMGIPVVSTGDRYDIDVQQKVPLNLDRDNVPPSYLQKLRTLALNATHRLLTEAEASESWVRAAVGDEACDDAAIERSLALRFGHKRVAFDPSDLEANKRATAAGYTVISGGALSASEWASAKRSGALAAAGQVTPSPKPYSENGRPESVVPREKWTAAMVRVVAFAKRLAESIMGFEPAVYIVIEPNVPWVANYGGKRLCLNLGRLGHAWFNGFDSDPVRVIDLLIHEFGHEYEGDHLSENYYNALTLLGAKAVVLALRDPGLFDLEIALEEVSHED